MGKIIPLGKVTHLDLSRDQVLHGATPGNDYCNGYIAPIQSPSQELACMVDCLHIDDVAAMLTEKGLDKRPEVNKRRHWPMLVTANA